MRKISIFLFALIPFNCVALTNVPGQKINYGCKFQMTYSVYAGTKLVDSAKSAVFAYAPNQFIKGLQNALLNKVSGYSNSISVTPENGYGARDKSKIRVVDISKFKGDTPEVGDHYKYIDTKGKPGILTVTKIDGRNVTIDANHPLAGKNLVVKFTVEKVNCNKK